MSRLVSRLLRWGLTRNPLRSCFLMLTVVGVLVSLAATGAVMYDLANRSIESWRSLPFDIRVTSEHVAEHKEEVASLRGVRRIDEALLLPLVLNSREIQVGAPLGECDLLRFSVRAGRMPLADDEIALDSSYAADGMLGAKIELALSTKLDQPTAFTVCGISENPLGISVFTEAGARRITQQVEPYRSLLVLLDPSASSLAVRDAIRAMPGMRYTLDYNEAQNYNMTLNIATTMIKVTRTLILLAGAGGLYMLVFLGQRERARELGVLRALGFGQMRLICILLLEGICVLLLGIGTAFAGSAAIASVLKLGTWRTMLSDNLGTAGLVLLLGIGASGLASFVVLRRPVTALIKE